jgi:hypothetical protein
MTARTMTRMPRTSRIKLKPVTAFLACLCIVSCGGPPGGSTTADTTADTRPLGHSVLTLEEARTETVFDVLTDSLYSVKFESALTHYGRIALDDTDDPLIIRMFNDSLRHREEHPFRIQLFMSRDTLFAVSRQTHGAVHKGDLDAEAAMLECLFEGPAVRLSLGDDTAEPKIDHLKSGCAGGLYDRLDLPKILRSMIVRIPSTIAHPPADQRRSKANWQTETACPSFAGLGLDPLFKVTYQIEEDTDAADTFVLVIECESSIGNIKTVLPNGEEASIVGGHYHLKGRLVGYKNSWSCVGGSLAVTEEISYVRPALGSAVLKKDCETHVTLTVRWDS